MKLKLNKMTATQIGLKDLEPFGVSKQSWAFRDDGDAFISLPSLALPMVERLRNLLEDKAGSDRKIKALVANVVAYQLAATGAGQPKAKNCEQMATFLTQFLRPADRRWLWKQEAGTERWLPYYVNKIHYEPPDPRTRTEASVRVELLFETFGGHKEDRIWLRTDDCRGRTAPEVLTMKGYRWDDPVLQAAYDASMVRFDEIAQAVGRQFRASGKGSDSGVDGNKKRGDRDSWYYKAESVFDLTRDGEPGRVILDVFFEEEKRGRNDEAKVATTFWENADPTKGTGEDDETEAEAITVIEPPQVPVHPFVVIFDTLRHLRLKVHVDQLGDYIYDMSLADKLVLPDERKALVRLLIELRAGKFQDIVKGKGGGAVVLLSGPPGTGKTLTAEVFAETEQRPLYSVQCSQLGTDPVALEDELLKTFARAKRWDAVMLLDEADVYVHERGNDLTQNAIVGVFLRVLEYQDSILFLTTNRPDDVDDAIASRCIAKLAYEVPEAGDQARIWRVLADQAGVTLSDDTIQAIVKQNPAMSGRDVKNLLKLAAMMSGGDVTPDAVAYVRQFKATKDLPGGIIGGLVGHMGISRCQKCGILVGRKGHVCPKGT